jgi:two-component system, cell cycle sensor histidine kinase and response regulator CckA
MPENIRVLFIEDSESDAALISRVLERAGFGVADRRVETAEELKAALWDQSWDVVIADYHLPQFDAPAALRIVRESELDIPFIVVSGTIGEASAVALMKAGAQDYLMKDSLARMAPVVEREVAEARARREYKRIEERLRDAQRAESIGVLAGGIAHQFNNILTAVSGNISLALGEMRHDEQVKQYLGVALDSVRRAAALTRQLLAYAGKGSFVRLPVTVPEAVKEVVHFLQPSLPPNVQLRTDLSQELPPIHIDPGQMQLLLANLIQNGVEAMGTDEGVVTIRTTCEPGYVVLDVLDTGCGMDAETQRRVFDPFFTTKFTGRGLGLAAVYGIVKSCNGEITVESTLGTGTHVRVKFPIAQDKASERQDQASSPTGTVLVVDDEESIRRLAVAILTKHGIPAIQVSTGRQALQSLAAQGASIRAVLLDMAMPDMHGHEALPKMKMLRPDIQVIVSSGYEEAEVKQRFKGFDVRSFLVKPYTGDQLLAHVLDALNAPPRQESQ